jgi:hypothetical protein
MQMSVLINFRELQVDDIRCILDATGYFTNAAEFKFAKDNDYFMYSGVVDNAARYLVAFESDEDSCMYVTTIFVYIGSNGTLNAEYGGCPVFESDDEEEIRNFFEERSN